MSNTHTEFVPGTSLPLNAPGSSPQREGRGTVTMGTPVSLLEKLAQRDDVSASELLYADAALRAYANQPKKHRVYWPTASAQTDGTTGNVVIPFFQVPQGYMAGLANVVADIDPDNPAPTLTPAAPVANAASWSFLARHRETSITNPAQAISLRRGMVAFAPVTAAGPILPALWTFGQHDSPIGFGGDSFYYVLVGGSQAALTNKVIQIQARVNMVASD